MNPACSVAKYPKIGHGSALIAAVLFGASVPLAKPLAGNMDPILLAGLLYLGSGMGLFLWMGWSSLKKSRLEASLGKQDIPWLATATLMGGILAPVFLMSGLSRLDAGTSSLLLNLEGVCTTLIAWFVFRENYNKRILSGVILIIFGSGILSWKGYAVNSSWSGSFMVAAACLCWGIDNNLTRKISSSNPVQIAAVKCTLAGMVNGAMALALNAAMPSGMDVLKALWIGFIGYGLSLTFFVMALRHIGAARTSSYFSTAPFVGVVLACLLFKEDLPASSLVAACLMGAGVWLHLTEHHEHEHVHGEMDHEHLHVHDEHHQHDHAPTDPPGEPHSHRHHHSPLTHTHRHDPDIHHQHSH